MTFPLVSKMRHKHPCVIFKQRRELFFHGSNPVGIKKRSFVRCGNTGNKLSGREIEMLSKNTETRLCVRAHDMIICRYCRRDNKIWSLWLRIRSRKDVRGHALGRDCVVTHGVRHNILSSRLGFSWTDRSTTYGGESNHVTNIGYCMGSCMSMQRRQEGAC
jgi:hypothetical protein